MIILFSLKVIKFRFSDETVQTGKQKRITKLWNEHYPSLLSLSFLVFAVLNCAWSYNRPTPKYCCWYTYVTISSCYLLYIRSVTIVVPHLFGLVHKWNKNSPYGNLYQLLCSFYCTTYFGCLRTKVLIFCTSDWFRFLASNFINRFLVSD